MTMRNIKIFITKCMQLLAARIQRLIISAINYAHSYWHSNATRMVGLDINSSYIALAEIVRLKQRNRKPFLANITNPAQYSNNNATDHNANCNSTNGFNNGCDSPEEYKYELVSFAYIPILACHNTDYNTIDAKNNTANTITTLSPPPCHSPTAPVLNKEASEQKQRELARLRCDHSSSSQHNLKHNNIYTKITQAITLAFAQAKPQTPQIAVALPSSLVKTKTIIINSELLQQINYSNSTTTNPIISETEMEFGITTEATPTHRHNTSCSPNPSHNNGNGSDNLAHTAVSQQNLEDFLYLNSSKYLDTADPDTINFDYHVLAEINHSDSNNQHHQNNQNPQNLSFYQHEKLDQRDIMVNIITTPKSTIANYTAMLRHSAIPPTAIDIDIYALMRAVTLFYPEIVAPYLIINLTAHKILFGLIEAQDYGKIVTQAHEISIDKACDTLTNFLQNNFDATQLELGVPPILSHTPTQTTHHHRDNTPLPQLLLQQLYTIIPQLHPQMAQQSPLQQMAQQNTAPPLPDQLPQYNSAIENTSRQKLQDHDQRAPNIIPTAIILCGSHASLNLARFIEQKTTIPTILANPFNKITVSEQLLQQHTKRTMRTKHTTPANSSPTIAHLQKIAAGMMLCCGLALHGVENEEDNINNNTEGTSYDKNHKNV
jgi:Tfp pilus assembly PilM family ATPase